MPWRNTSKRTVTSVCIHTPPRQSSKPTQWEQEPYHKTIANRTRHHTFSCTQRYPTMISNGSRSESALGRQRHDVNATHRDEVFHLVFSVPHRERWSARLVFLIFPVAPHTLLRANRPASCRNPLTPTTNPRKEHTQIDGTHHLRRRHPHQRRGNRLHEGRKENIRRPVRVPRIPIRPKQTLHKEGTPTPILRNQGPSKGDQTMTTRRLVTPKDVRDRQFRLSFPFMGYDANQVDDFLDDCALTIHALWNENRKLATENRRLQYENQTLKTDVSFYRLAVDTIEHQPKEQQ